MQSEFVTNSLSAGVAELADALDLGSSVPDVQVQVLSPAVGRNIGNGVPFLTATSHECIIIPHSLLERHCSFIQSTACCLPSSVNGKVAEIF